MHVSVELVNWEREARVIRVVDGDRKLWSITKLYLMLPKLSLSDRLPHVKHGVHLVGLWRKDQIRTASDYGLNQARLANFGITQHNDIIFKVRLDLLVHRSLLLVCLNVCPEFLIMKLTILIDWGELGLCVRFWRCATPDHITLTVCDTKVSAWWLGKLLSWIEL